MTQFHHKCWECDVQWYGAQSETFCWNCGIGTKFPEVGQIWRSPLNNNLVRVAEIEIQDNRAYLTYTILESEVNTVGETYPRIAISSFLSSYRKEEDSEVRA
jgi:hypothetical protein